ncbi:MAG TPA: hypothetical protein VNJ01_05610 [Bacteriovoracaceae bacterium]|nr:hypothetical protein [Bacteriovoracaceae bacterium]
MSSAEEKTETNNSNLLQIRLRNRTKQDIHELAVTIYGFDNTSEFIRYVLDFIDEKRPTLGKAFGPGSANP